MTDQRPTDLGFWKISNGHISATGHPIHVTFDSRVGFSGTADRMALLPVGPNPRWRLGYPIHFHDYYRAALHGGTQEKIMRM